MQSVETSAKTRQEAIQKALDALGVDMAEVEIEILDEGSSGIFGFGKREVKVKVIAEGLPDKPVRPKKQERPQREERPRQQEKPRTQEKTVRPDRGGKGQQQGGKGQQQQGGKDQQQGGKGQQQGGKGQQQGGKGQQQGGGKGQEARSRQQKQAPPEKRPPRPERQPRRQEQKAPREERAPRREKAPEIPLEPLSEQQREDAIALLAETIRLTGIEATVAAEVMEDGGLKLNVESPDSAILIGHKGRGLEALQYLINRMVRAGDNAEGPERIVVDIESYLERRRASLEEMALQLAQKAKETQREIRLKPLSPQERRIIHLVLESDPEIRTFSTGTSPMRSVVISPKNAPRREGRSRRGGDERRGGRSRDNRPPEPQQTPQDVPAPPPEPKAEQEAPPAPPPEPQAVHGAPAPPPENQNETVTDP